MDLTFDAAKDKANLAKHGIGFEQAAEMDFPSAVHLVDARKEYGEIRRIAVGYIDNRLHVLCYTWRTDRMHVISLRKANAKEARRYGKPQKTTDR